MMLENIAVCVVRQFQADLLKYVYLRKYQTDTCEDPLPSEANHDQMTSAKRKPGG